MLLRGSGCKYRRCAFCDYHSDFSKDETANFALNKAVLSRVTGEYGRLEVINSGSFGDLDKATVAEIKKIALAKNIKHLHFECHWLYRNDLVDFREYFAKDGIEVIFKIGIETFDVDFRENVLKKGMGKSDPAEIAATGFGEINLLGGIDGQTAASMAKDIEIGLKYFNRVCVNLMTANSTAVKPSAEVIKEFMTEVYPCFKDNPRVDILLENTDFGVG